MGVILITFCLLQESSKSKELNVYLQLWGLTTKRTTLCLSLALWIWRNIFQGPQSAPPRSHTEKKCSPHEHTRNNFQPPNVLYSSSFIDAVGHHSNLRFSILSALHIASSSCCGGGEKRRRRRPKAARSCRQSNNSLSDHGACDFSDQSLIAYWPTPVDTEYCCQRSFRIPAFILTKVHAQFLEGMHLNNIFPKRHLMCIACVNNMYVKYDRKKIEIDGGEECLSFPVFH